VQHQIRAPSYEQFSPTSLPPRAYDFQPLKPWTRKRDLHDLFVFIWAQDVQIFEHPRYRLQIALVILLIYHLGLHPNVALSEGLYYRDTRVILKKHDNQVRILILICMKGRKNFPKSKYWRGYGAQKLRCDVKWLTLFRRSMGFSLPCGLWARAVPKYLSPCKISHEVFYLHFIQSQFPNKHISRHGRDFLRGDADFRSAHDLFHPSH
jgi:hypothetical protein